MQRTFLTNLALLLFLNLLVKPFYILGIDAAVQVEVGSSAYGTYAALLSLSFILNILLDLGLTNFNTRNIAQHAHLLQKHLSGIMGLRIVLIAGYALVTLVVGLVLGYGPAEMKVLGLLVFNQALAGFLLYMRSNLTGLHLFAQDSLLSVLDRLLLIFICGWLLWSGSVGPFQIEWFIYAQTFAYGVSVLVSLALVLRHTQRFRLNVNWQFMLVVLRQSLPYALLILLMTLYYRMDSVMLERMLPNGASYAGIYAQGYRFFEALNMLGYLFAALLLPIFSRMLKNREDLAPLVSVSHRLIFIVSIGVAIIGSIYSKEIMEWRYEEHTDISHPAFALLMWCYVAVCTTYIYGTLLTAGGQLKLLNWTAGAGAVLNLVLNLILIPKYQVYGAAVASLITQSLTAAAQLWLARKKFDLGWKGSRITSSLVFLIGLLGLTWGMHYAAVPLLPALLIFGVGTAVLAVLSRTISWAEVKEAAALR